MEIKVLVLEMDQTCCGRPTEVDQVVTWEIFLRRGPVHEGLGPTEGNDVRYMTESHGQLVGGNTVTGRVTGIRAVGQGGDDQEMHGVDLQRLPGSREILDFDGPYVFADLPFKPSNFVITLSVEDSEPIPTELARLS